jgi:preprotein translocase subunit Sss1
MFKITIRRKNGMVLTKETNDQRVLQGYVKTAEMYGDKVLKVEVKDSRSPTWKPLTDVVVAGATLGIGLGLLGAVGNAFKK